jgi:phytoene dehydrogenase-like protein
MTDAGRIVVIGAGHNGLVCASYLARAGRKVLVLEASARVGGAAVTREFAPGFRVSAVAHLLHLLDPMVAKDLNLSSHGLSLARAQLRTVALSENGPALIFDDAELISGSLSAADRGALAEYQRRMKKFAAVIARQHGRVPPRLAFGDWQNALPAVALALDIRRLGRNDMREFLRVAAMNTFDVLEETFESAALKGALALDGVLGTRLGPRSGNTVYSQLYRMSGTIKGRAGAMAQPLGGLGAFSEALATAARSAGVEIRTASEVAALAVTNGRVSGVRLQSGEEIASDCVVSSADPKNTLLKLLGARHLEAEFARRVHHLRSLGTAAKLHLALSGAPQFSGLPPGYTGERMVIAPTMDYIEQAFNPAKYAHYSEQPVLEITLPSIHDPGLAPAGQHVLSAIVQYAPYDLVGGWDGQRERYRELILNVLERYAPGLKSQVIASELLTPLDIEREYRISGGHWHHGELTLDQFMMLRPVPGAAQYAMPVPGLYMCGAGCHPGGGVMGSAGRNAAGVILKGAGA